MKSASTSHSILGFIWLRGHTRVTKDSGPRPYGDLRLHVLWWKMVSLSLLSQGSGWFRITIWKPDTHGGC